MRSKSTFFSALCWSIIVFFSTLTFAPAEALAAEGATCEEAILLSPGNHAVDTISGSGGIFGGAPAAKWYYIIPELDGVLKVNSCGGNVDTRLSLLTGNCGDVTVAAFSDDDCESGGGRNNASSLELVVSSGTKYYIYWDNAWSSDGFDFSVAVEPLPIVNVTFRVNMAYVSTSQSGVFLAGNFQNWDPQSDQLTDEGNDTWTTTLSFQAGDTLYYKFVNGNSMDQAERVPQTCGISNGDGTFMRRYIVQASDIVIDATCFSKCGECPRMDCGSAQIELCDDFEVYGPGRLTPYTGAWDTWSGIAGGNEDPVVSTEQAFSGTRSMKIEAGSNIETQNNVLFKLGDKKTGEYELSWKMYIPAGKLAYYDIQKYQYEPGGPSDDGYAFQVQFDGEGGGIMNVGLADSIDFAYRPDSWIDVYQKIDVRNNFIELFIDGEFVYAWPFNYQASHVIGKKQLGAVHFKSNPNHLFYIDDIELKTDAEVTTAKVHNTIFTVDMSSLINQGGEVASTVYLVGDFNNWEAGGTPMSNTQGNVWSITMLLEEGATVHYKFLNGDAYEVVPDACGQSSESNGMVRSIVIDTTTTVADVTCFSSCVSDCSQGNTSATADHELEAQLQLYPNPSTGTVFVDYDFGESEAVQLRVFNPIGQQLRQLTIGQQRGVGFPVDLSDFPAGLYLFQFSNGLRQTTRKILIR